MFVLSAVRRVTLSGCCRRHQSSKMASGGSVMDSGDHLTPVIFYPRPHGIPAAVLHFRSHHIPLLNLFTYFAVHIASALGIPVSRPVFLPTQRTLWTVPRGPFIHKKSQENFDRKVHKRAIKAWDADQEVIAHWIQYLQFHQVPGVGLRVIRWERLPIGFGRLKLAALAERMNEPGLAGDREQIATLGKGIIEVETKEPEDGQEGVHS